MRWLDPEVTVAPTTQPVSLADAKAHLRVDDTDSDNLISAYIAAAQAHVEQVTGLCLAEQTIKLRAWGLEDCTFRLPAAPVSEITSITYVDLNDQRQTLDPATYVAVLTGIAPTIARAWNQLWPPHRCQPGSIEFTLACGYADGDCPAAIKQAMLLMVGDYFANRETTDPSRVQAIEMVAVDALLANFRRAYV